MERTDKLDWVAAAGIAVAVLIVFLAIGRYAYAEDRVRCVESPGKGQWHSARVEGRRCWFKGHPGKYEASELYCSAPELMPITQPMLPPSEMEYREMEYRWHDQTGWSHNE